MRKVIQPKSIPDPRPRYTQAIMTKPGRLLFIAGQTAVDAKGNVVGKANIEKQVRQVMENLKSVLKEAGASFKDVVKITVYTTDIKYRETLSRVRREYFGSTPPTSTLVVVKGLANKDYLVEIEAIAVI